MLRILNDSVELTQTGPLARDHAGNQITGHHTGVTRTASGVSLQRLRRTWPEVDADPVARQRCDELRDALRARGVDA